MFAVEWQRHGVTIEREASGSVELLSREGEIAIAKRIEAMIAGLCESPLTFPGDHHLAR
jgi:hypothetical protein